MTTSSETSTDRTDPKDRAAFQPWQFYILLAMIGATAAVIVSRHTHPLALLLLSAAVVGAGAAGVAFHRSLMGFFGLGTTPPARGERARAVLERDKALVLRSIKELEFDRRMGKVSEADFNDIGGRLRAHALALMQEIERAGSDAEPATPRKRDGSGRPASVRHARACPDCGTTNDADAKFCKQCGRGLTGA